MNELPNTEPPTSSVKRPSPFTRAGALEWSWINLGRLGMLGLQLVLLFLLVRAFSIESAAFLRVFALATVGFTVHALLPFVVQMPFFVLLSLASIAIVFGHVQGAWLVAIGLTLIGLVQLPVRFAIRLGLILAAGGALALFRIGVSKSPWSAGIWPIFGAMFMFRMIVYLYDLKNHAAPFGVWRSMAYFFMLPNVCFPLFPVVDYKTFSRGYRKIDPFVTYQTGVNWIFRGLIQLIVYRAVYQYLSPDPAGIDSAVKAALYFVRPYLLYLRISGGFHVAVGMLHLFGFNLPRTNFNYLLASSFTDYWRRINIYWKDFLQKIFFNPFYMRFKRSMNATAALILTTCVAFFATWALHSYQWFWIRGSFPVIWQDIVFWSVMGLLVLASMIQEDRRGRIRSLGKKTRSLRSMLGLALRTIGTFLVVCLCWAAWSTESLGVLRLAGSKLLQPGPRDAMWILAGFIGLGLAKVIYERFENRGRAEVESAPRLRLAGVPIPFSAMRVSLVSAAIIFLVSGQLLYPPRVADVIGQLRDPLFLNAPDLRLLNRGYYEELADVSGFNPQLTELYKDRPADWGRCWAIHRTGGFPMTELLPLRRVTFNGAIVNTNCWGMRDRDYEKIKPKGTYRIALLGRSHSFGVGVENNETFENLVEDRLNSEIAPRSGLHYEILNFSLGGWCPAACLADLEKRVFDFQPDAVIYVGITEFNFMLEEIIGAVRGNYVLPWPEPLETALAAGVKKRMDMDVALAKLRPHREELLLWVYRRMVDDCRQRGVLPIAAFIPLVNKMTPEAVIDGQRVIAVAREAGFDVIDMLDVYDSVPDVHALWVAKWDQHPNAEGHRMIAEKLYEGLLRELRLDTSVPVSQAKSAQAHR